MAQSVKLKDGSYIDAGGVYDATQGKTQEAVNAAQKTINSRVGTVIQGTWSAGSVTSSSSVQSYDLSTITLPEGIWLVIGHWEDNVGWLALIINATKSYMPLMMGRHIGQTYSDTLESFLVCKGGQNVTLSLGFVSPGKGLTYSWSTPNNLHRFQAICIG